MLLMTSSLGEPTRKPLTVAQFRLLTQRVRRAIPPDEDRDMVTEDLVVLGYSLPEAERILHLLSEKGKLNRYLDKASDAHCQPITRVSADYPQILRDRLGEDAPGTLWAKGDLSILSQSGVSVVGSRDLRQDNYAFAWEVGRQAAMQSFTLISGNARGADSAAQESCLWQSHCHCAGPA